VVTVTNTVFWELMSCSLVEASRSFEECTTSILSKQECFKKNSHLYLQIYGWRIEVCHWILRQKLRKACNIHTTFCTLGLIYNPEDGSSTFFRSVAKRYGATFQKRIFFIMTVMWIQFSHKTRVTFPSVLISQYYTIIIYSESENFARFSCHNRYEIFLWCPNWLPVWCCIFYLGSVATGRRDRKLHDPRLTCFAVCDTVH
jgi:hypothetical protein